jgi:predicted phosphodiesterase
MKSTRIAIIADIHANLPALEAVEADLDRFDLDEVIVAGDLVGRGCQGSAVVHRVAERGWAALRGNHEDYVLSFRRREVPQNWLEATEWAASRWMGSELDADAAQFLDALPFSLTARTAPGVRIVHGSPQSYCEGLGDWTDEATLRQHLAGLDENILVCAHTHRPMMRRFDDGLVVNVGSVGMPFNADWRAQYAIVTLDETDKASVTFRQVPYDRDAVRKSYETSGFLEEGGVTAHLLLMEIDHARPFLVPFLKWIEALQIEALTEHIPDFLGVYDPQKPLAEFFRGLP